MFNNIGRKIKDLAMVFAWIGIFSSLILGFWTWSEEESASSLFKGLIIFGAGSVLSWISSFFFYGFGQLIENSDILVEKFAPEYIETDDDEN